MNRSTRRALGFLLAACGVDATTDALAQARTHGDIWIGAAAVVSSVDGEARQFAMGRCFAGCALPAPPGGPISWSFPGAVSCGGDLAAWTCSPFSQGDTDTARRVEAWYAGLAPAGTPRWPIRIRGDWPRICVGLANGNVECVGLAALEGLLVDDARGGHRTCDANTSIEMPTTYRTVLNPRAGVVWGLHLAVLDGTGRVYLSADLGPGARPDTCAGAMRLLRAPAPYVALTATSEELCGAREDGTVDCCGGRRPTLASVVETCTWRTDVLRGERVSLLWSRRWHGSRGINCAFVPSRAEGTVEIARCWTHAGTVRTDDGITIGPRPRILHASRRHAVAADWSAEGSCVLYDDGQHQCFGNVRLGWIE